MTQKILVIKVMPTKTIILCGKIEVRKEVVTSVQVTGGKVKVLNGFSWEVKLLTTPMTAITLADMKKRTYTYRLFILSDKETCLRMMLTIHKHLQF